MHLERHSLLFSLVRWLIGSLTALVLTLPALEGVNAAPPDRSKEEVGYRALSFEERVAAQEAIEEVFWRHRIWPKDNPGPKPALEQVLPDSVIRERVVDYLKKSNALEKLWSRPLTAGQLQAEVERMARSSRQPEVLGEVFAALHNDPFLIAECLARPSLADRLLRNWYAFDDRVHGPLRAAAQQDLARYRASGAQPPDGAGYQEVTLRSRPAGPDPANSGAPGSEVSLSSEEYEAEVRTTRIEMGLGPAPSDPARPSTPAELPEGRFGPLQEDEDSFFAKAVIAQQADSMRVGILRWSKTPFETWWSQERVHLDAELLPPEETAPVVTLDSPPCTDDTWAPIAFGPEARYLHAAVWTGSEMLVWGGIDINARVQTSGFRYNPATDIWTPMGLLNAPSLRTAFTAVWTGTQMIIWGGSDQIGTTLGNGGRYDPSTNTWSATITGGPTTTNHSAIWTGTEMIVWGGGSGSVYSKLGGRYNPASNSWIIMFGTAPGVPEARRFHTAVWTGAEMIVWGGQNIVNLVNSPLNTGGRYSPATDSWSATGTGTNVPPARTGHTALWTGTQMIIYGGTAPGGDPIGGARYNPGSDTWSTLNTPLYPAVGHAAVWTGTEMIAWGGTSSSPPTPGLINLGFRYNPSSDTFVTTSLAGAPAARQKHTGVWTGTEMIVWGGTDTAALASGGRYDPAGDSWVPTGGIPSPKARFGPAAIWTGAEMIVWGGGGTGLYFDTGGRYVPATDTWSPTSTAAGSVPEGRIQSSEVWTGTEMIVWGGLNSAATRLNSGGRYNPAGDSWTPTGTGTNLPGIRTNHTAVWTGTEMIVWGGSGWTGSAPILVNSGGRYDPGSDAWMPTGGGANLPTARQGHTATWTSDRMFIWGGLGGSGDAIVQVSGGRYDPASDTWAAVSTASAPSSSYGHTAVWTGAEVIAWGASPPPGNAGGRYNPVSDTWSPTSTGSGVPAGGSVHTAVWANGEMIIWGGYSSPNYVNTGGRYDPASDTWTPTGTGTNVPTPRYDARAVWTGSEMLVWGGFYPQVLGTGGRYCRQCGTYYSHYRDRDLDLFGDPQAMQTTCNPTPLPGFITTGGDCLDTNAAVYPAAPQICDGLNDDCSDPSWPAVPANEANADGDAFLICQGDCDDAQAMVYPGALQVVCDGLNNDCLDPTWPTVSDETTDQDGDGFPVCADCLDANSQVWAAPSEVSGLGALAGDPTTLTWTSQSVSAGPGTTYDLVGGGLNQTSGFIDLSAASCLQPLGPNSFSDTRPDPPPGIGYWFLARGNNSCGQGTYGTGSFGLNRDIFILACP